MKIQVTIINTDGSTYKWYEFDYDNNEQRREFAKSCVYHWKNGRRVETCMADGESA